MNTDAAALEVTDALGPDFIYLQPPGEQRFDPSAVAIHLGYLIIAAVGLGIGAAIKDTAKDATKSLIAAVTAAVRQRASAQLRRPFQSGKGGEEAVRQSQREAREAIEAVGHVLGDVSPALHAALPGAVAAAIRESLSERRVPESAGARVERVITIHVRTLIEESHSDRH
jgi:hypothetical protein